MIGSRNANNSVLVATAAVASVATVGAIYWIASRKKGGGEEKEDGSSCKGNIYTIMEERVEEENTTDRGFLDEQTFVVDEDKVGLSIDGIDEHDVPALLDEPPAADYDENSMSSKSESNYLQAAISGPDISAQMLKEKVNDMMDAEEKASSVASTTASDMTGGDLSNKLDLTGVAEDDDSFLATGTPKKKKSLVGAFKKKLSKRKIKGVIRRRISKSKASSH
mmetsp:Transcript_28993/g.43806  ORF Transcript_28993/g.43806 Transcript_28993/m.43806 type:complete len:222 (+) Transcript_28993:56-721(+)